MIPNSMTAVLLTGHGGLDKLDVRHNAPTLRNLPRMRYTVKAAGVGADA